MAERGEPKNLADDVEDIKRIKNITVLMDVLVRTVDSCEKAALMYQKLGEELSKIRKKRLNKKKRSYNCLTKKKKIEQMLEEKRLNNTI